MGLVVLRTPAIAIPLLAAACGTARPGLATPDSSSSDAACPDGSARSNLTGACFVSCGQPLAADGSVIDIVASATSVYWTEFGDPPGVTGVNKVPIAGGAVATLVSLGGIAGAIAVDGSNVYFGEPTGIARVSTDGGAVSNVASAQRSPCGLVFDATNLYWGTADGSIRSVPLGGGPIGTVVASGAGCPIGVYGGRVFWADGCRGGCNVLSAPAGGGSIATALSTFSIFFSTIAGDRLYWSDGINVYERAVAGGAVETLATAPLGAQVSALAVAAGRVYFFEGMQLAGQDLLEVPSGGGAVRVLDETSFPPTGLTAGPSGVYWSEQPDLPPGTLYGCAAR